MKGDKESISQLDPTKQTIHNESQSLIDRSNESETTDQIKVQLLPIQL